MMCPYSEQGTPLKFQMSVKCSSEHEAACSHVTRAAQAQMQVSTCMMQPRGCPHQGNAIMTTSFPAKVCCSVAKSCSLRHTKQVTKLKESVTASACCYVTVQLSAVIRGQGRVCCTETKQESEGKAVSACAALPNRCIKLFLLEHTCAVSCMWSDIVMHGMLATLCATGIFWQCTEVFPGNALRQQYWCHGASSKS